MGGTRWPIVGNPAVVESLKRAAQTGQVGHAYLIAGPEGVGRRTLAHTFAQALLCTAPAEERPCGSCSACRRTSSGVHPDLSIVSLESQESPRDRDSKNTRISIETIRALRSSLVLRPLEARWRVAILEDADTLSREAYDALLKTLEEPPPFVVLFLIVSTPEAVPETIRSRCRVVMLEPIRRERLVRLLTERGVAPDLAVAIASVAWGRVGQALTLATNPKALATRQEAIQSSLDMIQDPLVALGEARRLTESFRRGQRDRVLSRLDALVGVWRDLLLIATNCPDRIVNADYRQALTAVSEQWSINEIYTGLFATYQAITDLSLNVQPRVALDNMVIQWPESR